MRTDKLLRQAGQLIVLGKLDLALEQYLKIHQLDSKETTVISTIGDLYLRLGKEPKALLWYQTLATTLESHGLLAQAAVIYKKILKLSPHNQAVMTQLAQLYEQQGQTGSAKAQYTLIADHLVSLSQLEQSLVLYQRICRLDPSCPNGWLQLARTLERCEAFEEASRAYLQCVELLMKKGQLAVALPVLEDLFRLRAQNKEFLKSFFKVLRQANLTARGVEYLQAISLDKDPEMRAILGEVFLEDGKFDLALNYLLDDGKVHLRKYSVCLRLLQELIVRKEVDLGLTVVEALFETSLHLQDEVTLKFMLDLLLEADPSNLRILKLLTMLVARMGRAHEIEQYSKRLVTLQLQSDLLSDARDQLNTMVLYGQNGLYRHMFNHLNQAMLSGSAQDRRETCERLIRALEPGIIQDADCLKPDLGSELSPGWKMEPQGNFVAIA